MKNFFPHFFHKDFSWSNMLVDISIGKLRSKVFSFAVLEEYRFSEIIVKFPVKNVGIIAYKAYIKGSYKGNNVTGNSYHTSTWVKNGKKWKMILHTEVSRSRKDGEPD